MAARESRLKTVSELQAELANAEQIYRRVLADRDKTIRELKSQLKERDKRIKELERLVLKGASKQGGQLPKIPDIADAECTPVVVNLLGFVHRAGEVVQALRDEIAVLKGEKGRPKIRPSKLETGGQEEEEGEEEEENDNGEKAPRKRPGSKKRSKTAELEIHETVIVRPDNVPEGSRFKGYEDFTVQDLVLMTHNTRYRLQQWVTPDGKRLVGKLPACLNGGHYGPTSVSFILYQHYHAQVTQPLLLEQLREFGLDISAGQLSRILTEGKERFHEEKDEILRVGLEISHHVNVDDTGARHDGKNGYCTHIGNEMFAWFQSTDSKSRINFLELLHAGRVDYALNEDALEYMQGHKLPGYKLERLAACGKKYFEHKGEWQGALEVLGLTNQRHIRIATEGALLGSLLEYHTINPKLAILSDDAGQFRILLHALCWIHAERTINKLIGFSDEHRAAINEIRDRIWSLYQDLKAYKQAPAEDKKLELAARFDDIFTTKTCYLILNDALERIRKNKSELLLVLERPDLPLHNNLSENDIREYVKKRKISGSTRSANGRRCWDTFTSLKKTCRKNGISFWQYLYDRICGSNTVPRLSTLMQQRALE